MFDGSGASEHSAAGPSAAPKSSEVNREGGAGATGQNSGGVGPGERVSDADLKNTAGPYDARAVAPVNHHVLNQAAAGVDDSHEMWDGAAAVIFTVATVVTGPGELIGLGAEEAAAGVQANRAAGNAFRDEIAQQFERGMEVEKEVYKWTPVGKRFIDIEVRKEASFSGE